MMQENEKSNSIKPEANPAKSNENNGSKGSRIRNIFGKKKANGKKQENLEICEEADDMPELNDDQEVLDDEEITLDMGEPPLEVLEYARTELGETDEVKCQMLQELRDMIYERGECLPPRMDDNFLLRFLRARNYQLNSAHRLVVNYCNFKEEHPGIHQQMSGKQIRQIGEDDVITVPSYRTKCGRRLLIYRIGNWDPRKYPAEELFKATVSVLELGILEPRSQILGGIVIFDLQNITMAHAWTVTPQVATMMLSLMVTAFPMKIHALHILHQSWVFDAIFAVFKPLLDSQMRNRLFFHGSKFENLHKHVPPEYLPKKYGGIRKEVPYYKWIEALITKPEIIEEMNKLGYGITDEILECFNLK